MCIRDSPPDGVGVVGAAPQHGATRLDALDPGEGIGVSGGVADQPDVVTDDDSLAPQLAGLHRDDHAFGDLAPPDPGRHEHAVAASVAGADGAHPGVAVGRTVLRQWPRPATRAHSNVRRVEVVPAHPLPSAPP